jgi:hypothetical protein
MNAGVEPLSPEALEDSADRLRRQIGTTLGHLRCNLAPRNLVNEIAGRTGVADLSPQEVFVSVTKRHPTTTILVILSVGVWALSAMRLRGKIGTGTIDSSIAALGQSGQNAFQRRAAAKRQEFIQAAETHISTGAERLLDSVEAAIGRQVSQLPVANVGGSMVESAVQMLLFAALEAMVTKARKAI